MISTAQTQNTKTQQDELIRNRIKGELKEADRDLKLRQEALQKTRTALAEAKAEQQEQETASLLLRKRVGLLTNEFSVASDAVATAQSRISQAKNQLQSLGR